MPMSAEGANLTGGAELQCQQICQTSCDHPHPKQLPESPGTAAQCATLPAATRDQSENLEGWRGTDLPTAPRANPTTCAPALSRSSPQTGTYSLRTPPGAATSSPIPTLQ